MLGWRKVETLDGKTRTPYELREAVELLIVANYRPVPAEQDAADARVCLAMGDVKELAKEIHSVCCHVLGAIT